VLYLVEGIIEWEDREVLRRINTFFKDNMALSMTDYESIIKDVRKYDESKISE